MELTTSYCPHPHGVSFGGQGWKQHLVRRGYDRGVPRLWCTHGHRTFSVRQGTAYFGLVAEERIFTISMRALAEGNSLRGTARIIDVDVERLWNPRTSHRHPGPTRSQTQTQALTSF